MAWAGSDRRAELPPDWPARVAACKAAAGGRCEQILPSGLRCPRDGVDVDHKSDPSNHDDLQLLCRRHHDIKTAGEAQQGRAPRGSRTRAPETHPGRTYNP